MAPNFEISVDKKSNGYGLNLVGDFDATSAYELIYAIKTLPDDIIRISIHTDGLKTISPLGLDVFHRNMSPLDGQSKKIVFTGNKASHISPGDSRLSFSGPFWMETTEKFFPSSF